MKYIIIYKDNDRTLVFQSDSKEEVNEWFEATINDIQESGGYVTCKFHDVAQGHLRNDDFWKITIYNEYEINKLKRIKF